MLSRVFQIRFVFVTLLVLSPNGSAQIPKGHQILIDRGLQLQSMAVPYDNFHLSTYSNANYTAIHWLWDSNPSLHGPAPGFPWARWVRDETEMPPCGSEGPYMNQLLALQLGDEWNLNDNATRTRLVNWFIAVSNNFPNTILFHNNFGGQVGDAQLGDFISRARPDAICFDAYPWHSVYDINQPNHSGSPIGGQPVNWYSDMRRYREHARANNIPLGVYRQTFHAVQDYDQQVFRDPSPSELRLSTFAALALNAKMLIDFKYNDGSASLFTAPGGDNNPNALYYEMQDANRRARNFGRALVRLKPIYDLHNPNNPNPPPGPPSGDPNFPDFTTTSIMFLRGKYLSGAATNLTALPIGLQVDPQSNFSLPYSWWESDKNDPYLRGWVVTNTGTKNNGLPGEVIIAWFRPLDESLDGPAYTSEVYIMVVNALIATNGTAADCLQEIKLNFLNTAATASVILLDSATGQLQTNALPLVSTRRQLVLNLNGGDAALFKFNTGAPFVGWPSPAQVNIELQSDKPVLTIQGTVAARYQIEAASSLPAPNWSVLTNLVLPTSPYTFTDTTSSGNRFYRVVGIP